jgi:hypothetical protein
VPHLTPAVAASLGIAIVHQHPALLPDLTVAENLRIAVPSEVLRGADGRRAAMQRLLDDVDCSAHLDARVSSLTVAQKHLVELAKALATSPRLLILDEPTAPLGQDSSTCCSSASGRPLPEEPPSSTSPTGSPRSASSPTASRCFATGSREERRTSPPSATTRSWR